jgi:transglutaminase-like putative cysteine protease
VNAATRPLLPLLVAISALGHMAHAWPLAVSLAAMAALLASIGPRLQVDFGRQLLSSAVGGAVGYVSASLLHTQVPGGLSEGWTQFACAALMSAAARCLLLEARGGTLPALGLTFAGLLGAGKAQDSAYVGFAVAFLATSLWALDSTQQPTQRTDPRRLALGTAIIVLAATLGLGTTLGVRQFSAWLRGHTRYGATGWKPQVGFSDRMDLGALDGLLDSPKRVLRVQGPHVDYLRGVALDTYRAGRWMRSEVSELETQVNFDAAPGSLGAVEINSIGAGSKQLFVPLSARQIVSTPPTLIVDGQGALEQEQRRGPWTLLFETGTRDVARPAAPTNTDMELPLRLAPYLLALARQWTIGEPTAEGRLAAIEKHLRTEYAYSREFKRPKRIDPLLDFLYRSKRGHCEYFASALALLGRAAGVPSRVVMGYRVGERSPFGYYLVRERNAHAWVEAFLPGIGWTTRDATPEALLPQNRHHEAGYAESSVDAIALAYEDFTDWVGHLSLGQTSIAWILGALILAAIVSRGARRRVRRRLRDDEIALPSLMRVLSKLERSGYPRSQGEPLEQLAARLPLDRARELLRRYVALRYGSVGDPDQFSRDVNAWLKSPPA